MNDLLLSEIKTCQQDFLSAIELVEDFVFNKSSVEKRPQALIEFIIEHCEQELEDVEDPLAQAEHIINVIFLDLLFVEQQRATWPVKAFQLTTAIENRLMFPIVKAIVIHHVLNQCGFEADLVYVPEKVMIRLVCDQQYAIIFDPTSGESLNWQELDNRLDELSADPSQYHMEAMDINAVLTEYLTGCKDALIKEGLFVQALKCVDVLLALKPDDPFERRDRGFLLHQLDCFKVAYDDYQYFVEQCPQDPAAQLLKIQLEKITITNTILH